MHVRMSHRDAVAVRRVFVAALFAAVLAACAPAPPKPDAPQAGKPDAVVQGDDLMAMLLAAQFALQDNDLDGAARGFADAAMLSTDPAVAEEATRLAIGVKQWPLAQRALARWQQLAADAPGLAQARALIAFGEHRDEDAYRDLAAIAARGDEQAWRLIAQALLNAGDKATAARMLGRLATPQHLPASEANWVAVSQLAFKLDDKALARQLADAAVAKFGGSDSYLWSGRLALDRGDKAAARQTYVEASRRHPRDARVRGAYAALLAADGDNAGAARALAGGPQDDQSYGARAAYAARADGKATLAALYREMQADTSPRRAERLFLLGQVGELLGKREEALRWYREVGDDAEHWFDAQVRQAVLLDRLDRTAQALDFLHELQARTGEDQGQLGSAYLLEAEILAHRQRQQEAIAAYARGLAALPDDPRLLYARALLAVDQGDVAGAERDLRRVLELKPDDAEALNALGYTLADSSHRGDPKLGEARELIRRAIELKPNEPAIIDSLGWLHYRMGDLDASLKQLRRAYEKQPDPGIAAHLGEVLWVKGERGEARKVWDEGRRRDPKNKSLLETIRRLASS